MLISILTVIYPTWLILGLSLPTYPSFHLFAASSVSSGFFFLRPPWTFHSLSCVGLLEVWADTPPPLYYSPIDCLGAERGNYPPNPGPAPITSSREAWLDGGFIIPIPILRCGWVGSLFHLQCLSLLLYCFDWPATFLCACSKLVGIRTLPGIRPLPL